mmetsp:Transcript_40653/g.115090  ORF Transcript_40653/g.115090 Transcript_40653/m.115090 type:complete len:137 (+) Transcript_40653:234-644(+)
MALQSEACLRRSWSRSRSALVFSATDKWFLHFDSAGGTNSEAAHELYKAMAQLFGGREVCKLRGASMAKQGNGHDCGVYVLGVAKTLVEAPPEKLSGGCSELEGMVAAAGLSDSSADSLRKEILQLVEELGGAGDV